MQEYSNMFRYIVFSFLIADVIFNVEGCRSISSFVDFVSDSGNIFEIIKLNICLKLIDLQKSCSNILSMYRNYIIIQTAISPLATCTDGIKNQGERDVDCGGPCHGCSGD